MIILVLPQLRHWIGEIKKLKLFRDALLIGFAIALVSLVQIITGIVNSMEGGEPVSFVGVISWGIAAAVLMCALVATGILIHMTDQREERAMERGMERRHKELMNLLTRVLGHRDEPK